jgi:hypothetical protein
MLPYLAERHRPSKAIAVALGLGLIGVATHRRGSAAPPPARVMVPIAISPSTPDAIVAAPSIVPDANAADVVGIYRSASCTLTLDASGTYISDCGGGHAHRYAIEGEQVVLVQPIGGAQRLTISPRNRLVAPDGTIYSITGGTR